MPAEIIMPALSPTMEKGTIARWLVGIGDAIQIGTPLVEVETDKATMEVEADQEGIVARILVSEGAEDVPVGTPIATLDALGSTPVAPSAETAPPPAAAPEAAAEPVPEAPSAAMLRPAPAPLPPAQVQAPAQVLRPDSPIKATPLAWRLASIHGLDLATVTGSGPAGRIRRADLGLAQPSATMHAPSPSPAPIDLSAQRAIPHEETKLSSMRRTIARRLTESKQQIPHIYLTVDLRLDALLALRASINASLGEDGIKVSINDMLMKALALALRQVPECNVSFAGDSLLRYQRVDISMAVALPNGLITPVLRGADTKSLSALAAEARQLAALAREGRLQPSDYQGGTASISNMGMMGIRQFAAVINPPQAMILAAGAAEKRPVIVGEAIVAETLMTVTGSFDHRAIDGADGARLMNALRDLVENPLRIIA